MSVTTARPKLRDPYADHVLAELAALPLVESDGVPMESHWHLKCMSLLIEQIEEHFKDRTDFYVGGNMFIYYSSEQAKNKDDRGPDFFFVWNTSRYPLRNYWAVWDEQSRTPDVVIELLSHSTEEIDRGLKFDIYRDRLKVGNYFVFDPDTNLVEGWCLVDKKYVPIRPDENGRLLCDELDLLLGPWPGDVNGYDGRWLRFFDHTGKVLPSRREERDAERHRADAERRQRESAEAENARLRELLAKAGIATEGQS